MYEQLYLEIEHLVGKGQLKEALALAQEKRPNDPVFITCVESRILEKQGDYVNALRKSETALQQLPTSYPAAWFPHLVHLYALWRLERYTEAIDHFEQMNFQQFPKLIQARFHNIIGLVYWSWGKNKDGSNSKTLFEFARNHHEKSLNLRKGNPTEEAFSHNNLGNTLLSLGLYQDALNQYLIARKIREKEGREAELATTIRDIGRCLFKMERYREAKDSFLEALKIQEKLANPNDLAKVWFSLAEVEAVLGGNSVAPHFRKAKEFAIQARNRSLLMKIEKVSRKYQSK